MALETLAGVRQIGSVAILDINEAEAKYKAVAPTGQRQDGIDFNKESWDDFFNRVLKGSAPIIVDHKNNTISFKIQDGPIKENGINGCQLTDMVEVATHMVSTLNETHRCRENSVTITKWEEGLMWQEKRTKDRETRNVEGTSAH